MLPDGRSEVAKICAVHDPSILHHPESNSSHVITRDDYDESSG